MTSSPDDPREAKPSHEISDSRRSARSAWPRGPIQPKGHSGAPPAELYGRPTGEHAATTPASEIKELVRLLDDFTIDELRQIPVVQPGSRLEQGSVYIDLTDDDRTELVAPGGRVAEHGRYFVPKRDTPTPYWNRLIGAQPRERRE